MGIIRDLRLKNPKSARVEFGRFHGIDLRTDGEVGGYNKAKMSYNFSTEDGALKSTLGVVTLNDRFYADTLEGLSKVYFFKNCYYDKGIRDDRILIYCDSGNMYEAPLSGGKFTYVSGLGFKNRPIGVCYNFNSKDVIIFSAEGEGIKIYDGDTVTEVLDAPSITSMCMHSERLFVTSGGVDGALWFSDDFDPTNWNISLNEAGFIDMNDGRGDMLCAVSFAGYLYVFRSYGVSRVSAFVNQDEFSVSHLVVSCGKIIKDSVTVCGDCILFFASDGLYRFDGTTAVKISSGWDSVINKYVSRMKGVYYDGYAYYQVGIEVEKGKLMQGMIKVDPYTGDCTVIYAGDIYDLAVVDSEDEYTLLGLDLGAYTLCTFKTNAGCYGDPIQMRWYSKESDFGITSRQKNLREISFYSNTGVTLTVWVDGKENKYTVKPDKGRCRLRPNLLGSKFSFLIFVEGVEVEISGFALEFTYY